MSLLRLLTAGKSLVPSKEGNRYRVTSQRLLPKFEAKKNPFGTGTGETETSVAAGVVQDGPEAKPKQVAEQEQRQEQESQRVEGPGWFERLKLWRASRKAAKPQPAPLGKAPVQTELSLEKVRVVRNDLSDADLEIVPAKKTKPASAPAVKPAPTAPGELEPDSVVPAKPQTAPQHMLARLGGRLFTAGKS